MKEIYCVIVNIVNKELKDLFQRNFCGGYITQEEGNEGEHMRNNDIRPFKIPKIYCQAKAFYQLTDMSDQFLSEPPVVMDFSDEEIVNIRNNTPIKTPLPFPSGREVCQSGFRGILPSCWIRKQRWTHKTNLEIKKIAKTT